MSDKPENLEEWFDRNYPETENTTAAFIRLQQQYGQTQNISNHGNIQYTGGKYSGVVQNQQDFINTQSQSQSI